jgi:PAS domain S-box-containing protein
MMEPGVASPLILNVDDTEAGRYAKSRVLRHAGYEVIEAATGRDALRLAAELKPALVLLDVKLPDISGLEVCQTIKRDHPEIAVLQISASFVTGSDRARGLDSGADSYLTQPVEPNELIASVRALLRIRAAEARMRESEEHLRLIVESATDHAIITVDTDGVITSWSPGAEAIFGWRAAEVVGKSGSIIFTPEDREAGADRQELDAARSQGCAKDERWHITKDAQRVFLNGSMRPLHDARGNERGFLKVARDETERRRQAEALAESEANFRALADNIPTLCWMANPDGWIYWYNRRWHDYTGTTPEQMEGWGWQSVHDPDILPQVLERWKASLASGEPFEMVFPLRGADGVFRPFLTRVQPLCDDAGRIARWFGSTTDISEQRAAQDALRELNETLESQVEDRTAERDRLWALSEDLLVVADYKGHLLRVSPSWTRLLGHDEATLLAAAYASFIHPDDLGAVVGILSEMRESGRPVSFEDRVRAADGSYRWIAWTLSPDPNGGCLHGVGRDMTADKERAAALARAEEQLRQAQKMEAVGQLTGGVAHDFNNLLQVVVGNLEMLQRGLPTEAGRLRRQAENAMNGARRAATLTQRLLAFSRRQPLAPKPINVNQLVSSMSDLLARTLGETIQVETVLAGGLWRVEADPNQLESALLNLAVNARDAMPDGGKLTIETQNAHLDSAYVHANVEVTPGQYVVICTSDTGTGMDKETLAHVFEPFFTTKEVGRGTGLGLSQVYGFVKQSGGHVKIYSEPGHGTTVKIYLPRLLGTPQDEDAAAEQIVPEGTRAETVLVVEDDDDVRAYTVDVLREIGYRVLEAHDGGSALRLLERQEGNVDLLFTDVVLPGGINGEILGAQAQALRPGLKVLFTTGYARNAIVHHGRLDPGVELITKPFTYADLAAKVRDVLDAGGGSPPSG